MIKTYEQGPRFKIAYDSNRALLQIDATLQVDTYFGLVLGPDMSSGTDIIMF